MAVVVVGCCIWVKLVVVVAVVVAVVVDSKETVAVFSLSSSTALFITGNNSLSNA